MISFLKSIKNTNKVALVFYLLINTFFVLKYFDRQDFVSKYLVLLMYLVIVFLGIFYLNKFSAIINRIKKANYYVLGLSFVVFLLFVFINFYIDGNSLNADWWSAMDVTIASILNGEYPYGMKDHLGQTSSNLPALFYIGLPFYFLGDVGLLQPFVFLLISLFLFKSKIAIHKKVIVLFLLLMSPSYLWEIIAKSDLMSNIILLILFLFFWDDKFKNNYFKKPLLLSFFCAFFVLTRGIVVIPLTLFLFRGFLDSNLKTKLKFIVGFTIFSIVICLPILINLPNTETIIEHNPFNHQTKFTPKFVQILFILLPFLIALKRLKIKEKVYYLLILLSILLFVSFAIVCFKFGFDNALYKSYFDISYLGIVLPFTILYFVLDYTKLD